MEYCLLQQITKYKIANIYIYILISIIKIIYANSEEEGGEEGGC